jgi:uncharacterized protein YkwD
MKGISHCRSAVVFAGFLWAAVMAGAGPDQAQTSTQPDAPLPPQAKVQAVQNTPQKKPAKLGEWHHFGEDDNASVAGQNDPGAGQQLAPNPGTPRVVPAGTVPRQTFTPNRMSGLERLMWALVNRERLDPANSAETGGRAQPLQWNEKLAAVARAHSRDMIEQRYFDHVDRQGRTLAARINAAGIPWRGLGENIALNGTVPGAEAAFMNEPRFQNNHRGNILNANYTEVGIGIVPGPNGSLYITQDFVAIPPN